MKHTLLISQSNRIHSKALFDSLNHFAFIFRLKSYLGKMLDSLVALTLAVRLLSGGSQRDFTRSM